MPESLSLGDRMKERYEGRTEVLLPRRTYTIIRLDGKAFHTWTSKCKKPYDFDFMACMDITALNLTRQIQGAELAYVQSDEISVLLTDFAKPETEAWFNGNVQKIVSVAASIATASFNREVVLRGSVFTVPIPAHFDARVFTIPDPIEVENYFIWRQKDAVRNSIQMLSQFYFSDKELHGKSSGQQLEMILNHGDNWEEHSPRFRHGSVIHYVGQNWMFNTTISFAKDRAWLKNQIPIHWENDESKS